METRFLLDLGAIIYEEMSGGSIVRFIVFRGVARRCEVPTAVGMGRRRS